MALVSPPAAAPISTRPGNTPGSTSPSSAPTAGATTAQLDAVLSSLPLLRAQKDAAELQRAIRDAERVSSDTPANSIKSAPAALEADPLPATTAASASPFATRRPDVIAADLSFVGAAAFNGQWMATLSDSAGTYDVHLGDTLPSGWKVTRIDPQAVELARGRQRRKVGALGVSP
ncbi:type IV pilus biogenesis protein PilP [Burkholderia gladioli]|uniref:type IV pilus biogenesis protein PilP n=1 Tax=Burkholderia gladioli TaxID=28095 RepID=UPI00163ECBDB|nr:type IV pilus biogenesis protein PilP [Burkholderia gladioli]